MSGRLVLHIGDYKTGSTAIQTMLAQGDCQPEGLRLFTYGATGNHSGLARSLNARKALYPGRWQVAERKLAEADWDVAVLSSELFEQSAPMDVATAIQTHFPQYWEDLTVIAYIRPHFSRMLSQCAENLKLGYETGGFDSFLDRFRRVDRLRYFQRMERWRKAFGPRLIVRPFLRDRLAGGDVRRDFLDQALRGVPYRLSDRGPDDNASLPLAELALMRRLQRRFHSDAAIHLDNRTAFGKQFGLLLRQFPAKRPEARLRLPLAWYEALREEFALDAQRMDAAWFAGPCLAPQIERAGSNVTKEAQSLKAETYFSEETLRQADIWADMMARLMHQDPKAFRTLVRQGR